MFLRVREHLLKVPMAEVGISSVTEAELRFGVARIPGARKLAVAVEEFLLRLEILPWDSRARAICAVASLSRTSGEPMGNLDMMIAAQALAGELVGDA